MWFFWSLWIAQKRNLQGSSRMRNGNEKLTYYAWKLSHNNMYKWTIYSVSHFSVPQVHRSHLVSVGYLVSASERVERNKWFPWRTANRKRMSLAHFSLSIITLYPLFPLSLLFRCGFRAGTTFRHTKTNNWNRRMMVRAKRSHFVCLCVFFDLPVFLESEIDCRSGTKKKMESEWDSNSIFSCTRIFPSREYWTECMRTEKQCDCNHFFRSLSFSSSAFASRHDWVPSWVWRCSFCTELSTLTFWFREPLLSTINLNRPINLARARAREEMKGPIRRLWNKDETELKSGTTTSENDCRS